MAHTTAWLPNRSAQAVSSSGVATAAVLNETLSAPGSQNVAHLLDAAHAAADGEWHESAAGGPAHDVEHRPAPLVGRGDVEEDDLVGALAGVPLGQLGRVAFVGQVHELRPLHDAALVHVEARDHATGQHHATSAGWRAPRAAGARPSPTKFDSTRRPASDDFSGWNCSRTASPARPR